MSKTSKVLETKVVSKDNLDKDDSKFLNTVFDNLRSRLRKVEQSKRNRKEEK